MNYMNYLDFDLLIERTGNKYKARVLNSPTGQATTEFDLPFTEEGLENFVLKIGRPRRSSRRADSSETEAVKVFGGKLFEAVFQDDIHTCFRGSLDEAARQEAGLRLRLRLADVPELVDIPWEYLYHNSTLNRFLCLSVETPLVRYLDLPERIRSLTVKPPLRILVMISSPTDYPRLDVEQEWARLNEALGDLKRRGLVELQRLDRASLINLQKQLRQDEYHIFHFVGHGGIDKQTQEGVLILENENGLSNSVSGQELGTLLHDERTLRLALLNACEGARNARSDPFAGVAQSLLQQGIPAVIAMQFEVTDEAAITLAHQFYDALADGYPVDAALTEARKTIFAQLKNVEWGTPVLYMRSPDGKIFDIEQSKSAPSRARVFISYKRNIDPDQTVALQLYESLRQQHDVFIDQNMLVGTPWVDRIMRELHESDFLITLLSGQAVQSEMLQHEIATAHELASQQKGRPRLLPIRLAYSEPFQYPLNKYLDPINWASWKKPEDTPRLIDELNRAIAGGALPSSGPPPKIEKTTAEPPQFLPPHVQAPPSLDMPEGTMELHSTFYVKRKSDDISFSVISRQGVTITIKAPRQMGKSSLLIRTMAEAQRLGKRVAFLDFQLFDKASLNNADQFYHQFCSALTDKLDMKDRLNEFWKAELGNNQSCSRYVSRYLLSELKNPLVLVMDEVESIFDTDFRSDFFGMLRNWHNSRAIDPIWKQLDLLLVTSTEPYQLIQNLNQSPFNVGEVIELDDFTLEQVADLNQRHDTPLTPGDEQHLMTILSGHPYLVRRALYLVASKRLSVTELFSQASDERGPFGDHLRYHLFRFHGKKDLIEGMQQVISKNICTDDLVFFRLRGAGLVKHEGRSVVPRCQLYAIYFREHLHV